MLNYLTLLCVLLTLHYAMGKDKVFHFGSTGTSMDPEISRNLDSNYFQCGSLMCKGGMSCDIQIIDQKTHLKCMDKNNMVIDERTIDHDVSSEKLTNSENVEKNETPQYHSYEENTNNPQNQLPNMHETKLNPKNDYEAMDYLPQMNQVKSRPYHPNKVMGYSPHVYRLMGHPSQIHQVQRHSYHVNQEMAYSPQMHESMSYPPHLYGRPHHMYGVKDHPNFKNEVKNYYNEDEDDYDDHYFG